MRKPAGEMRTQRKFLKIRPRETFVDRSYQRELNHPRVEQIAGAFKDEYVGVPVVSRREDGRYAVVDGQHRLDAMLKVGRGEDAILMEVREGMTVAEEASLFLELNGLRTAVAALFKFRARLKAEEPTALEIAAILKRNNCRMVFAPARGGIMAVQAVESAHRRGNLSKVIEVLYAWLDGASEAFDGSLIRAVSIFLAAYPEADTGHLVKVLEAVAPERVRNRLRREYGVSHSWEEASRLVLADIYNKGQRRGARVGQAHAGE